MSATVYVLNGDPHDFSIQYYDNGDPARRATLEAQWQSFNRTDPATGRTYKILVRPTNHIVEVTVDRFLPPGTPPGRYRVETFVPSKYATTRRAIFTIARNVRQTEIGGSQLEYGLTVLDMYDLHDVWQPLGEFFLDPGRHSFIGRVRQYDLSREDPPAEISFGPVRWVALMALPADGPSFDSPVGTQEERQARFPTGVMMFGKYPVWAGEWFDVNPFLNWYTYGYHTGADLNLPGSSGADKGEPVYAIGDGLVTYAGKASSWGNIVVIEHPKALVTRPNGRIERQQVYSRYGHVDDHILVRAGEKVKRGQQIGYIGLAAEALAGWHLHFDVSYTDMLKRRPAYWPGLNTLDAMRSSGQERDSHAYQSAQRSILRKVLNHFVDPLRFIQDNHGDMD